MSKLTPAIMINEKHDKVYCGAELIEWLRDFLIIDRETFTAFFAYISSPNVVTWRVLRHSCNLTLGIKK